MKVFIPNGQELNKFEQDLKDQLEQVNLDGYALISFRFGAIRSKKLHEIDAVIILNPGFFFVLEATFLY